MMTERQGVEIDYCPQCRGVWLDRGELDKIIERSDSEGLPRAPVNTGSYEREHNSHDYPNREDYGRRKKKKSFLGEMFDFD
jgi:Zn-finger nucleic acid-binding protein